MQSFCAANGLTISIPNTEIVVFGGGHHDCVWKVAGQHLKRSKSFTYLGMLFHEDSKIRHDAIAIAHNGCSYGWAAQVFKCFAEHGKSSPLVAGAPVEVQPDELQLSFQMQRQAAFDAVPLDPRSCPGPGVKLCTYRRWFSRPAHQVCPVYLEVPMSTAKLQRILRFRMGSHLLPIEQGRHLRLPRHRRVCRLCHTGALGDERHMLLECPALADLRDEYSPLVAECSGVMARLVWARNQPMVSRYIIACLDRMSC